MSKRNLYTWVCVGPSQDCVAHCRGSPTCEATQRTLYVYMYAKSEQHRNSRMKSVGFVAMNDVVWVPSRYRDDGHSVNGSVNPSGREKIMALLSDNNNKGIKQRKLFIRSKDFRIPREELVIEMRGLDTHES